MLWFLPLAKALAHEQLENVGDQCLLLFKCYAELQRIIDSNERLTKIRWDSWCGDEVFKSSTGWRISVFNDCTEFDYIDNMWTPEGLDVTVALGWDYLEQHGTIYAPTEEQLQTIWDWNTETPILTELNEQRVGDEVI